MVHWINEVVLFITGLGLGTIFSTMIRKNFEQKKFLFEIKLLKYCNLIAAYQDAVVDTSNLAKQKYVSAQRQVELIANNKIVQLSKEFYGEHGEQNSLTIMKALLEAMRKDLGINH